MYLTIHSTLFAPDCAICFVFVVSFPIPILTASGKFWAPLYILTLASFCVVVLLMYPSLALSSFHQPCIHIAPSLNTNLYSS